MRVADVCYVCVCGDSVNLFDAWLLVGGQLVEAAVNHAMTRKPSESSRRVLCVCVETA